MAEVAFLSKIDPTDRIVGAADILFLVAFVLLSSRVEMGRLDIFLLALVVISIGLVIWKTIGLGSARLAPVLNLVQFLIAGLIVARYCFAFFTDLASFTTLILAVAIVAFGITVVRIALSLIGQLMDRGSAAAPEAIEE